VAVISSPSVIVKNTSALLVKNGTSIERNAYTPITIVFHMCVFDVVGNVPNYYKIVVL